MAINVARIAGRTPPTLLAVCVGAVGGLSIALKPHFVLLWVALEALLMFTPPRLPIWRRIEAFVAIGVFVAYAAAVLFVFPEYVRLIRDYGPLYSYFFAEPFILLFRTQGALWATFALGLAYAARPWRQNAPVAKVLVVSAFSLAVVGLLQRKGWAYQFYPALAVATMLLVLLIYETSHRKTSVALRSARVFATALLVATGMSVIRDFASELAVMTGRDGEAADARALEPVVRRYGGGNRVMIFSPTHSIAFPLVLHVKAQWASRFISMWPIRAFYDARRAGNESFATLEREFQHEVVDDLIKAPPELIVVDVMRVPAQEYHGFNGLRYFEQDQRFGALMTEYERVTDIRRYRIFRRVRPTPIVETVR